MPEFYAILARKIIKIPELVMTFARKINKIPEFYMIFVRKMPEFYITVARKIVFPNFGRHMHVPPSPTPYDDDDAVRDVPSLQYPPSFPCPAISAALNIASIQHKKLNVGRPVLGGPISNDGG